MYSAVVFPAPSSPIMITWTNFPPPFRGKESRRALVDSPGVVTDTEDTDKVTATCFRRDPGEEVLDLGLVVLVCPVLPLLPGPGLGLELDPVPREERHRLVAAAGVSVPPVRSPAVPRSHVVVRVLGQEVGAG